MKNMYQIIVNGIKHAVKSTKITVRKRSIYSGDLLITDNLPGDTVKVEFIGDLASLDCTSCVITGDVKGDVDATSVKCGNITGDVDGTTINCNNIVGDVDGTTINCKTVKGNISM